MRRILTTVVKLALVALLLTWLVRSGRLDFHQLRLLVDDPVIMLCNLAVWAVGSVLLGTFRWWLLLRGLGLVVDFSRALRLQLIGLFFNTTMPGAVGGDIVKAVYVIKEQAQSSRTAAMLTVLLDRVVGLAALFVMAGVATLANPQFFVSNKELLPLSVFVGCGLLGLILGYTLIMFPFKPGRDPFKWLLGKKIPGFSALDKIYEALRAYRRCPRVLLSALLLSIIIQTGMVSYALMLTHQLTGQTPDWSVFFTIFPIGIMTTALPLAPGGLGLGHVAFDKLFSMVGMTGGANIFNVMVLGQLSLNLLGFIPYLLYRSTFTQSTEALGAMAATAEKPSA